MIEYILIGVGARNAQVPFIPDGFQIRGYIIKQINVLAETSVFLADPEFIRGQPVVGVGLNIITYPESKVFPLPHLQRKACVAFVQVFRYKIHQV